MKVQGVEVSEKSLSNVDLGYYIQKLQIPFFRGVFMKDTLPKTPYKIECGIMNLNKESQEGSHWVCWYKFHKTRIYFDSFGQHVPYELIRYLKTPKEYKNSELVLERNTLVLQHVNTSECGALCLFVLKLLTSNISSYEKIIYKLRERYLKNAC